MSHKLALAGCILQVTLKDWLIDCKHKVINLDYHLLFCFGFLGQWLLAVCVCVGGGGGDIIIITQTMKSLWSM